MPDPTPDDICLILAATTAQARQQSRLYQQRQGRLGLYAWRPPEILPFSTWVVEQWLALWPETQLLGPVHELALYREAMSRCGDAESLLDPAAVAKAARRASALATEYQLDANSWTAQSEEQAAFQRWFRDVTERSRENGWVTRSAVYADLVKALASGETAVPQRIRLVGIGNPTPLQQSLLDGLEAAGCQVEFDASQDRQAEIRARQYKTREEQYAAAAAAASAALQSDMAERFIIALPAGSESSRRLLDAQMELACAPLSGRPGDCAAMRPWRYDQAPALKSAPLAALLLELLGLRRHGNDLKLVSHLLLSPLLWPETELAACAAVEWRLRDLGYSDMSLDWLIARLNDAGVESAAGSFTRLNQQLQRESARALPSQWAEWHVARTAAFPAMLAAAESEAFTEVADDWQVALNLLASLDNVLGEISAAEVLRWLQEICSQRHFQAASGYPQPLRIVSYSDLPGLQAEEVWILDALDNQLPLPRIVNAFLPGARLAEQGAPATPELATEATADWLHHCQQNVTRLVICAPLRDEDGIDCMPSPLIAWGPECDAEVTAVGTQDSGPVSVEDDPAPAVGDAAAEGIGGGTGLLQDYANAPFIAFAKRRLGCQPFPDRIAWLDALRQGDLTHAALEQCWDELGNSEKLRGIPDPRLEKLCTQIAETLCQQKLAGLGAVMRSLESARLADVLFGWLKHEQRRAHDFRVVKHEYQGSAVVRGLALRYRIDRIDAVDTPDGERILLIDYKTGSSIPGKTGWTGDDLREPQLPFYACYADLSEFGISTVDGIAFGHVREGGYALQPLTNFTGLLIPNSRGLGHPVEHWDERKTQWRASIEAMVEGFMAGYIDFDLHGSYLANVGRDYNSWLAPLMRSMQGD